MARLTIRGLHKYYGKVHALRGDRPRHPGRRVLRLRRPLRLRQVHAPAHHRRPGGQRRRHDRHRRRAGRRRAPARPQHRHGVPELRALPLPRRVREHRLRPARAQVRRKPRSSAGSTVPPPCSASARCSSACRASFPAASASASPSAGRSSATPACSCSTSRCPTSTPSSATACAPRSSGCTRSSARPRSTSPTTRSRP